MKIYCAGAEAYINQVDRIRSGFLELGHDLSTVEDCDLIYCNDPSSYDSSYKSKNKRAKIIYNVLDLPPHCIDGSKYDVTRYPYISTPWAKDFDPKSLAEKLRDCDLVTCICEEVQWQLKNWCDVNSKVIYNPIKDVSFLDLPEDKKITNQSGKKYKYLYVGRANDPNKRFDLVRRTMEILGDPSDSLAVIGTENPRWGDYYGVVSDEVLNTFYNSVEYFFFPSAFKSIGLPALESIVTKTKTIVCQDDPTSKEFWAEISVPSDPRLIADRIKNSQWNDLCLDFVNSYSDFYKVKFNKKSIAENILLEYDLL